MRRFAILALFLAACEKKEDPKPVKPAGPDRVRVRHILVSFAGSGTEATRTMTEAEAKAKALLERLNKGDDFERVMQRESDDRGGGVYWMVNEGVTPGAQDEMPRERMVKGFGDAAFSMEVNEIRLVPYDAKSSPYGWHIVQRLE